MSKHLLVSSFEITAEVWVGDTESGTASRIALQPFKVRPQDLAKWVMAEWPQQHQRLKEQVALIEIQEVEQALFAELRRAEEERQLAAAPPAKAKRTRKSAAAKASEASEEAAVRSRTFQDGGQAAT